MTTPISILLSLSLIACSNNSEKNGEQITNVEPSGEPSEEPASEPGSDVNSDDVDDDGDGFTENDGDCDDTNSQINPDERDRSVDGVDQNCDGVDGQDEDEDGYVDVASGGDDCNDNDPNVNPGATEDLSDGVDTNCDGINDPGFFKLSEETVDDYCFGQCDRVAISVDAYRQAHVVYEYDDEIWYNFRTTQGDWDGFEEVAEPSTDSVVACDDTCTWAFDGECDDGGEFSDYSICALGTDCSDCGDRVSEGDLRELGVAGLDAKVDSRDRVQVAFTEEGASFTALKYIYRDTNGTWSDTLEIDGPSQDRYNVGADVAMDIDSNDEPTFVYYNGEDGVPKMYDMNGDLLQSITGAGGLEGPVDIEIPEIDITAICFYGYCASDLYGSDVVGGYSGLYNSIVIDEDNEAHTAFYNHNEIQELVHFIDTFSVPFLGTIGSLIGLQTIIDTVNSFAGFEVVGAGSGTINQYASISITGISSIITGNGGFCFNDTINDGQNIYNSLALKTDGSLCAAYFDNNTLQVKYSCNAGACDSWPEEIVAQANVGASGVNARDWPAFENRNNIPKDRVRLAFNKQNEPYVVYHNSSNNSINIALKENNVWTSYPIGQGGEQLDVDIDAANYIHIAYIDNSGSVKYILGQ